MDPHSVQGSALVTDLCMDMAAVKVGWPMAVLDDLRWASGSVKYASLSAASFEDWAAEIKGNGKYSKGQIKSFLSLGLLILIPPPYWS